MARMINGNSKYLVTILPGFWESKWPDWNDKEPMERTRLQKSIYNEIDAFLSGSINKLILVSLGWIKIQVLAEPGHRVRIIRSAGVAIKY